MRHSGEFLIACVLLTIAFPLMIIIAVAIKCDSPGPVFERLARLGRGGQPFQMLSFRTTAPIPGENRVIWQTTQLGRLLRRTRIDALPQLINVLRGDMSLIDTSLLD